MILNNLNFVFIKNPNFSYFNFMPNYFWNRKIKRLKIDKLII